MLKKRRMLLSLGAASLVTGPLAHRGLRSARAQGRPLTFCSWGGALSELEKNTMLDPFAKLKKIEIAHASPTNYAKIKAMVEARRAGMGPGGRRRPLHRPGQGHARNPRHEPHPECEEPQSGLGHEPRHLHVDRRDGDRVEHEGLSGGQGSDLVEGFLGRQGLPRSARPLQAALLQLRSRAARRRRAVQPDLSGHRRQDQGRVRQAARDQAARESVVDRGARNRRNCSPAASSPSARRGPAASSR